MASDITTLLIQMIRAGSTQTDGLAVNSTVLGGAADLLSLAANYVQILGTLEGPVAQGAVSNEVAQIAADQAAGILLAGSASESAALATVSATGAGAVIVVIVSLILAVLTASGGQSSDQSQLWQAFNDAIKADLAIYWFDKLTGSLSSLWTPVGNHLDDLANEGTGGKDVMNHVSNFHDDAMGFVNLLVKGIDPDQYWQVPAQSAGDVPQSSSGTPFWPNNDYGWSYWTFGSWYGQFPARSTVPGSPSGTVSDPRTMAPVLALGIQSYLILESLLNVIDPTQPTLQQFVNQFRGDLAGHPWSYLDFLYEKYQLAVKGIVKTDLPSEDEILGTLWWITQQAGVWTHPSTDPNRDTSESWGAPYPRRPDLQGGVAFSGNGWAWNFIYGASETYPQYGFYGTAQADGPMLRNIFTRSYVVTWMLDPVAGGPPVENVVSEWQQAGFFFDFGMGTCIWINELQNWTIPWISNRIILGRMARWKAIYLLNAFDGVWSVLQALQRLAAPNPPIVPSTMHLPQDGTIANGNWSTRELCRVVQVNDKLLTGNAYVDSLDFNEFVTDWVPGGRIEWTRVSGHSVGGLVQFLYNVANGNWARPPLPPQVTVPRPLSFRGLLAGAAA